MRIRLGLLLCSIRLEVYSFSCLLPCLQLVMDTDMELWRLSDHWCSCSHWVRKGNGPWPRRLPHTTRLCCTAVASLVTDSFSAHTKDMRIWGWKGRRGFPPLPCYCLRSQWTRNSYLSQRQELLTHFSKWMMTCKLSRPAHCFVRSFVLTSRKTQVKDSLLSLSPTLSQWQIYFQCSLLFSDPWQIPIQQQTPIQAETSIPEPQLGRPWEAFQVTEWWGTAPPSWSGALDTCIS